MIQHQKLARFECPNRSGTVSGPVHGTGFFNKNDPWSRRWTPV